MQPTIRQVTVACKSLHKKLHESGLLAYSYSLLSCDISAGVFCHRRSDIYFVDRKMDTFSLNYVTGVIQAYDDSTTCINSA